MRCGYRATQPNCLTVSAVLSHLALNLCSYVQYDNVRSIDIARTGSYARSQVFSQAVFT